MTVHTCVFKCNLPPTLLEQCPGSLMCHSGNMGWNGPVFPITHNCRSIMHRFQFWHTDERPVCHIDTHIFSAISTIDRKLKNKAQKVQPHLQNQIPIRNAAWFKSHSWKLYLKADWLKIHFLSPLSSSVSYHFKKYCSHRQMNKLFHRKNLQSCSMHLPSKFDTTETRLCRFSNCMATHHAMILFAVWFVRFSVLHNI